MTPSVAALASAVGCAEAAARLKFTAVIVAATMALSAWGYQLAAVGEPVQEGPKTTGAKLVAESQQPKADQLGDPLPDGAVARLGTSRLRHGGAH